RLQEEWAAVASATPDKAQSLWERFRTARQRAAQALRRVPRRESREEAGPLRAGRGPRRVHRLERDRGGDQAPPGGVERDRPSPDSSCSGPVAGVSRAVRRVLRPPEGTLRASGRRAPYRRDGEDGALRASRGPRRFDRLGRDCDGYEAPPGRMEKERSAAARAQRRAMAALPDGVRSLLR